jgi:thymidylate synthase
MSFADKLYLASIENILKNGYHAQNRTGVATYKLPHQIFQFDLSNGEFPILTTKFVAFKTAIKELLWIFKDQSNDVKELQKQNVHIWDSWTDENGFIGPAYGYQIFKYKQIDKLIDALKNNPQDRRMIMDMWNFDDLPKMILQPCCFLTMWDVTDGKLNCCLVQRSGDMPLGVPFNTSQYTALVYMIAQVTNLKVGLFTHIINNAHIYENQIEGMKIQLSRKDCDFDAPKIWLNPKIMNFYDFTADDIELVNYIHHDKIQMEVSV